MLFVVFRFILGLFFFFSLFLFPVSFSYADTSSNEVIIKYKDNIVSSLKKEDVELRYYTDREIENALNDLINTKEKEPLKLIKAKVLKVKKGKLIDVKWLSDLYDSELIDYLEPNYKRSVSGYKTPNDSYYNELWGLYNQNNIDIDAPEAWESSTGSNDIVVGVLDTGIDYKHKDLKNNMWVNKKELNGVSGYDDDHNGVVDDIYGFDAINDSGNPMDLDSHGTHCAGIIGARGENSTGVVGVNWHVKLMALRFLDENGNGYDSDAIKGIAYAVKMKKRGVNIRVLNHSWGGPDAANSLRAAFQEAEDAGIFSATSAGNEGLNLEVTPYYPANYVMPSLVTVAAVDKYGSLASFSNYSSKYVHIGAPGVHILSTVINNQYAYYDGTSMAAPYVSGAAALVLSVNPSLTPREVKELLMNSVKPLDSLRSNVVSEGMISAGKAISGEINYPPTIEPIADVRFSSSSYTVTVNASDRDGDSLSYSASINSSDKMAYELDSQLDLDVFSNDYEYNSLGYKEKWVKSEKTGKLYFIKPGGILFRFDEINSTPLLGVLGEKYYDNPDKLCNASTQYSSPASVSFSGNKLSIFPKEGFIGDFEVEVGVSDGVITSYKKFNVEVYENTPPEIEEIKDKVVLNNRDIRIPLNIKNLENDDLNISVTTSVLNPQNSNSMIISKVETGHVLNIKVPRNFTCELRVNVNVSDGAFSRSTNFKLTVIDINDPRASSLDTDNDGVGDLVEIEEGSDLYDSGSFKTRISSPSYALWNGFLGMQNILELVNTGLEEDVVNISFYSIEGILKGKLTRRIEAKGELDIILNELSGFRENSYGIVKIEFSKSIDGRLSYYRFDGLGGYEFAFAVPFLSSLKGKSFVSFNTFQPSHHVYESNNVVQNWLSIVNLSSKENSFLINSYSQNGELIKTETVKVAPFGRVDKDGGHGFYGTSVVGAHEIKPLDDTKPYLAELIRYGSNAVSGQMASHYSFAFPLLAKAGSGRALNMHISNMLGGSNWVEIINTLGVKEKVTVSLFNSKGERVYFNTFKLKPHSQNHIYASKYLKKGETGLAVVKSESMGAIVSQSMFYFRGYFGEIQAMYGTQGYEPLGSEVVGSYNLYLGMKNWVRISNTSSSNVRVYVSSTGKKRVSENEITIPKKSSINIPLHFNNLYTCEPNSYGTIVVRSLKKDSLISELLRVKDVGGNNLDYVMPTLVR